MAIEGVALRKRQQIAKANRTMFFWIAGVSVIVGIAAVISLFLVQKAMFNEKVLAEKSKTASTLVKNNAVVEELQNQIRVLNTNDNLKGNMVPGETQPVQVVLDALPATANSSAFGASLQQRFLQVDNAVRLESLNVDPVREVEVASDGSAQPVDEGQTDDTSQYQIRFNFTVTTGRDNAANLKELLIRLERSVRPIVLTSVSIEATGEDRLELRAEGYTYYQPAQSVELKDKVVKP